jgi:hypothetical protein
MLNVDPISANFLNTHQAILYDRPLVAEIFKPARKLSVECGQYRCELWVMPGAHAVRFDYDLLRAAELVTDQEAGLPESGVLSAFLCSGERDYEHRFERWGVEYLTTVQSEALSQNVYCSLLDEARTEAKGHRHTLIHEWQAEAGACLSAVTVEPLAREVRIEAFHFLAEGGVVLRTGSVFEHA